MTKEFDELRAEKGFGMADKNLGEELKGETFVIVQVNFNKGNMGEYANVKVQDKGWYRTGSTVLLDQLDHIKTHIQSTDEGVEVTLEERESSSTGMNYYIFN